MGISNKIFSTAQAKADFTSVGWLSTQPPAFQEKLLDRAYCKTLSPGQSLFSLGDEPGGIFGILVGYCDVIIAPLPIAPKLVHVAGPGWWVGDAALVSQTPRRAGITARTECRIIHVSEAEITRICAADPLTWRRIGSLTVSQLDHAMSIVSVATIRFPMQATRLALLRLIGHGLVYGLGNETDPKTIPILQSELAEIANLSRNAVGDALRKLAKQGAVKLDYRAIIVLDRQMLIDK